MPKLSIAFLALAVTAAIPGHAFAQSARADIEAAIVEFAKAYNAKDAAAVAQHYTEDGAVLPPDAERVDGREGIQKFWQGAMDGGVTDLSLKAVEVEESGDLAYEVGEFALKAPGKDGKPADVSGKYVVVWKKAADGDWRLHRDIWNANPAK